MAQERICRWWMHSCTEYQVVCDRQRRHSLEVCVCVRRFGILSRAWELHVNMMDIHSTTGSTWSNTVRRIISIWIRRRMTTRLARNATLVRRRFLIREASFLDNLARQPGKTSNDSCQSMLLFTYRYRSDDERREFIYWNSSCSTRDRTLRH